MPECGDGEINGDEVCDDGENDGSYGGCAEDCSALGPHCGDDEVQGSEDCDDGDPDNGDGCNIDCTVSGEIVWTRTFDGVGYGVAVDDEDNAVVITFTDANARQYDAAGMPGWMTDFSLPLSSSTSGAAVACDGQQWLVGGSANVTGQASNAWWRRLDEDGVGGDFGSYDSAGHVSDTAGALAFDGRGNFYVVGATQDGAVEDDSDAWVRKFDPAGLQLWARTFDGGNDDHLDAVAVAPDDTVVVGGYTEVGGQGLNTWLRKYDPEGATEWTRTSAGPDDARDLITAVAVGADGSIASAGTEATDIFVRLHSPGGVEIWTRTYDGPAVDGYVYYDSAFAVAIDSQGAVVAGGAELVVDIDLDPWLRKYDADGDVLWTASPEASDEDYELMRSLAITSDDYVIITGNNGSGVSAQGWLVKYTP